MSESAYSGWQVIGQWRNSWIIAADAQELVVIDQHVAHERILFEEYLTEMRAGTVETAQLLLPLTIDLTPAQSLVAESFREQLQQNGFLVSSFGPRTLMVQGVPALAAQEEIQQLIEEVLSALDGPAGGLSVDDVRKRLAASLACHGAIKANTPMNHDQMTHLLRVLFQSEDPTLCPHGRPIVMKIHVRDLERNFKRR